MSPSKSANNTPSKDSGAATSKVDVAISPSPSRKVHTCTKCNRPKLGHPRAGCPFVNDSPNKLTYNNDSPNKLTEEMSSMTIDGDDELPPETPVKRKGRHSMGAVSPSGPSPSDLEDPREAIRRRRSGRLATAALAPSQTLPSLSDSDLEALMPPVDKETDDRKDGGRDEEAGKTVHWKERIEMLSAGGTILTREQGRAKMPGTLATPWGSFFSVGPTADDNDNEGGRDMPSAVPSLDSVESSAGPRPPTRTMSMDERDSFMQHLEEISTGKVYVLTKANLAQVKDRTPKGLYVKVLMVEDGSEEGQNVLIVGRDENGVEKLFQNLKTEAQMAQSQKRGINLKVAAGGALVGAFGAFTGLAFS